MVIDLKKTANKADIQQVLARIKKHKILDAKRFVGTVKWPEDPLTYQKRLRDEW